MEDETTSDGALAQSGPRPPAFGSDARSVNNGVNNIAKNIAKNIVLCSDGTGNSGGKGYGTNVWRLYNSIDLHGHVDDPALPRQVVFYDDGVGTEDFKLWKLFSGAFGFGLSRNIRDLYAFLVKSYRPGDTLYIFGFSRGAFTARSLAGLVARCGVADPSRELDVKAQRVLLSDVASVRLLGWIYHCVLRADIDPKLTLTERTQLTVRAAFNRYRREHYKNRPIWPKWMRALLCKLSDRLLPGFNAYGQTDSTGEFRSTYSHGETTIRCVGVWDTVGALGAPSEEIRWLLDRLLRTSFHRQELHKNVEHGFHALAIDDERHTFHPVMWKDDSDNPERVQQVWFAGAHSNVGGGYPKQGMSLVSMLWMMRNASALGLRFQPGAIDAVAHQANVTDKLYDPRAGLGAYYRYSPRDIAKLAREYCQGNAKIHASVFHRIASGVQDYAPANLPPQFQVVDDRGAQTGDRWRVHVRDLIASKQRLEDLRPAIQRMITTRQVLYHGMVATSFVLASGMLLLWLKRGSAGEDLARSAERMASWLEPAMPSALANVLAPLGAYFVQHPSRLLITAGLLAVLYIARNVLDRRAQRPLIEFWSQLRTKLLDEPEQQPVAAEPEPESERARKPMSIAG